MLVAHQLAYPSWQRLWWSTAVCGKSVLRVLEDILQQLDGRYAFADDTQASERKDIWVEDVIVHWQAVEQWRQIFRRFMLLSLVASLIASMTLVTPLSDLFGVITLPFYLCAAYAALSIYDRLQFAVLFTEAVVSKLDELSDSASGDDPLAVSYCSLASRRTLLHD